MSPSHRLGVRIASKQVALLALVCGAGALTPRAASAQAAGATPIAIAASYPKRGNSTIPGKDNVRQQGINRADCARKEPWTFRFTLPTTSFATLQVFVRGSNKPCSPVADRTTTKECFRAATFSLEKVQNQGEVVIPAHAMINAIANADLTKRDASDDPTAVNDPSTDVCYSQKTFQGPQPLFLDFILFSSGTSMEGTESQFQTTYMIAGPNAPTGVTLGAGDTLLVADWTSTTTQNSAFRQYVAYCFPTNNSSTLDAAAGSGGAGGAAGAGGGAGTGDASTAPDASAGDAAANADSRTDSPVDGRPADATPADAMALVVEGERSAIGSAGSTNVASGSGGGSGGLPGVCPSGLPGWFAAGQILTPEQADALRCGSPSASAVSKRLQIGGLVNEQPYAVAIAGYDIYENAGPLSEVVCNSPGQTIDFFDAYRAAGGRAGGGYCAFGGEVATPLTFFAGGGMLALLLARRIRRRSANRSADGSRR